MKLEADSVFLELWECNIPTHPNLSTSSLSRRCADEVASWISFCQRRTTSGTDSLSTAPQTSAAEATSGEREGTSRGDVMHWPLYDAR